MENLSQQNVENKCDEKLEKLFAAARNARDTSDDKTALKMYEEIAAIDPSNWEALFYLVILKTNSITNGEITNAASSVINCLPKIFDLINTTVTDVQEKKDIVKKVVDQCYETATWLNSASYNFYNSVTRNDVSISVITAAVNMDAKRKAKYESAQRSVAIGNIMCCCGNAIEKIFGIQDDYYHKCAVFCWEKMLQIHFDHIKQINVELFNEETIEKYATKIKALNPSFVVPEIKATEKRNYAIKGILLALLALGVGILIALPLFNMM